MRRWLGVGLGILLVGLAAASMASASPPSTPDPFASASDGPVSAIANAGATTYVAGRFDAFGLPAGAAVAVDAATGRPKALPNITGGSVRVALADGSGGWFVGGDFDRVAGAVRYGLAHVRGDGTIDTAFPQLREDTAALTRGNELVDALALAPGGGTLYVGGVFDQVGSQTRNSAAAINLTNGQVTSWDPHLSVKAAVSGIAVGGSSVFLSGAFSQVGIVMVGRLAKVSATTGLADAAFDPAPTSNGNPALVGPLALNSTGTELYAAGPFDHIGGQARSHLARLSVGTGAADAWNPSPDVDPNTILVGPFGSTIYIGGTFTTVGGATRRGLAAIDATSAAATSWAPQLSSDGSVLDLAFSGGGILAVGRFTSVGGLPRPGVALLDAGTGAVSPFDPAVVGSLDAAAAGGSGVLLGGFSLDRGAAARSGLAALTAYGRLTAFAPQVAGTVSALALSPDRKTLYIGGEFTSINGQPRASLAAFDTATGALRPWSSSVSDSNPHAFAIDALAVSRDGKSLYVGGRFDRLGSDLQPRSSLGAVSTSDGKATAWTAGVSGGSSAIVSTLALSPDGATIYVGGEFDAAGHNSQPRPALAALSTVGSGDATAWAPNLASPSIPAVTGLSVAPNGVVYAAGDFTTAGHNAQPRFDLAAISPSAPGNATAWNPSVSSSDPSNPASARAVAVSESGTSVFIGGRFDHVGGQVRTDLAEVSATTGGAGAWTPDPGNKYEGVDVIETGSGAVRIGGRFDRIGNSSRGGYAQFTAAPVVLGGPKLSGRAVYGRKLICSAGAFANSPFAFAFGWVRDGKLIAGQTGQTYTVRGPDSGHLLACAVVGSNARGSASAQSATVRPGPYILSFTRRTIRGGFRLSFRITERARVAILIQRQRGRRRVKVRTLHINAHAGLNSVRIRRRSLVSGAHYVLTISARDSHKLNANVRRLKLNVPAARRRHH